MNAPIPPSGPTASIPAATLAAATRGIILNAPSALALSAGQVLEGRVVSKSNGQLLLQSRLGPITIQTTASPATDAVVLVQVRTGGATPQVQILPQAGHGAATSEAGPQQPAVVKPAFTPGSVIHATVAGRGLNSPAAAINPQSGAATPATAPVPPSLTGMDAGAVLALRVLGVSPPGGTAAPPVSTGAHTLIATVAAHSAGSLLTAQPDGTMLSFANAPPLPPGTRLTLELLGQQSPATGRAAASEVTADRWTVLREIMHALRQGDPGLARTFVDSMVASPGPKLAPTMLFVLSAVFSGDLRRFLGDDAIRALGRRSGVALERLSADMAQAQRVVTDGAGQDWRLLLLPILTEEGVDELQFFVRTQDDDDADEQNEQGIRFLLDVTMSRLGAFRFDGFARDRTVNLIIRTHKALPAAMHDDIRTLYLDTLSALGFAGSLSFRMTRQFDPAPADVPTGVAQELTV